MELAVEIRISRVRKTERGRIRHRHGQDWKLDGDPVACAHDTRPPNESWHGEKTKDLPNLAGLLRPGDRGAIDEGGTGSNQ